MEKEIWKQIKNYENYEISNFGNVRNTIFKNRADARKGKKL